MCSHEFAAVPPRARARVPASLPPFNFTHVANNVLCSARLHPARGAVLSLLVMLMTFARAHVGRNIVVETHARAQCCPDLLL